MLNKETANGMLTIIILLYIDRVSKKSLTFTLNKDHVIRSIYYLGLFRFSPGTVTSKKPPSPSSNFKIVCIKIKLEMM